MLSTDFVPGSPNWIDLGSPDVDRTAAFYRDVLGWTLVSLGPEAGGYGFFQLHGRTVAAVGPLDAGQTSAWTIYFSVPDADATTKAVEQAGGAIRLEPMDVFTNGRMAQFTDPGGAEFAVWQPGETKGVDVLNEPGSVSWVELLSADPKAAQEFYGAALGWTAVDMPMAEGSYTLFSPESGGADTEFAGVAPTQEGHSPHWLPYFETEDVDAAVARATEAGGSVVMPATDYPDVGRMAWLTDPFGARFALMRSAQQQAQ
ncbi:VOC family protein [Lentzea tibetensis]|uniref:VOC family protein n=1 Tax=Lentzea tibetensis TaxID=2591470 RepID=A0A563EWD4_9PSEU|nr:VOC family protein [Lentzea tibetensis]TWP52027.1 VOC family protein [Lentzea tibetensis]